MPLKVITMPAPMTMQPGMAASGEFAMDPMRGGVMARQHHTRVQAMPSRASLLPQALG
jgi:hypothetical protein